VTVLDEGCEEGGESEGSRGRERGTATLRHAASLICSSNKQPKSGRSNGDQEVFLSLSWESTLSHALAMVLSGFGRLQGDQYV
jgi:hypothetical protein